MGDGSKEIEGKRAVHGKNGIIITGNWHSGTWQPCSKTFTSGPHPE